MSQCFLIQRRERRAVGVGEAVSLNGRYFCVVVAVVHLVDRCGFLVLANGKDKNTEINELTDWYTHECHSYTAPLSHLTHHATIIATVHQLKIFTRSGLSRHSTHGGPVGPRDRDDRGAWSRPPFSNQRCQSVLQHKS